MSETEQSVTLEPCPFCGKVPDGRSHYEDTAVVWHTGDCRIAGVTFSVEQWNSRASVVAPQGDAGISWAALLAVLQRLFSKTRNPGSEWYHGWNAAIQCLINDINACAAASVTTPVSTPSLADAIAKVAAMQAMHLTAANQASGGLRDLQKVRAEECEDVIAALKQLQVAAPATTPDGEQDDGIHAAAGAVGEYLQAPPSMWNTIERLIRQRIAATPPPAATSGRPDGEQVWHGPSDEMPSGVEILAVYRNTFSIGNKHELQIIAHKVEAWCVGRELVASALRAVTTATEAGEQE